MFFITKDGVKNWKEGDAWYKPASVEGYESKIVLNDETSKSQPDGMSKGLKIFLYTFTALIVLCALFALAAYLAKKLQEK